jgi:hypothetical protein
MKTTINNPMNDQMNNQMNDQNFSSQTLHRMAYPATVSSSRGWKSQPLFIGKSWKIIGKHGKQHGNVGLDTIFSVINIHG